MSRTAIPAPVLRAAHAGSVGFGQLTAESRVLPRFLVCGGQRCGTTSLYRALTEHPAVLKAVWHKGVHYFDTSYERGPRWYRGHFPLKATAERIEARLGVTPQAFESSPYYLYHPLAGARIARDLPGVRLLVLVRDPVERAFSHHAHEVARGFEPETDFVRALGLESRRLRGEEQRMIQDPGYYSFSHQHHAYRARGEYIIYLHRLARLVGRHRVRVIDSGRFFAHPQQVYEEVLAFLELPRLGSPTFAQHNARPRPGSPPESARADLAEHFRPYDLRLRSWLGHSLSWMAS